MILLVVFAKLTQTASEEFKLPVKVLMWAFVILFITISILLTSSVFFKQPVDLQFLLVDERSNKNISTNKEVNSDNTVSSFNEIDTVLKHEIGVNYMRLFGASAVPTLMQLLEARGEVLPLESYRYSVGGIHRLKHHREIMIPKPVVEFWKKKWEFKDAVPIKTDLWQKFSGNWLIPMDLLWTSLTPNQNSLYSYLSSPAYGNLMYTDSENYLEADSVQKLTGLVVTDEILREHRSKSGCDDDYEIRNSNCLSTSNFGYLFAILTNNTDKEIKEVEIIYTNYINSLKITGQNFKAFKTKQNPEKVALKDADLVNKNLGKIDTLKLASLKPNTSIIWLISCFKKLPNGLADYYMTNVSVPKKVNFIYNNLPFYDTIRLPYGEKAARLDVPYGWTGQ